MILGKDKEWLMHIHGKNKYMLKKVSLCCRHTTYFYNSTTSGAQIACSDLCN